jgi:DNA mismatch endonuclease (patch repair protein)
MRLVRRRHTAVELQLASALRKNGLRFSTHKMMFGCTPDIIFDLERIIVFVDGDFWHGRILIERGRRALAQSFKQPIRAFWVAKIVRNAERDSNQVRMLRRNGWVVLRFWEKDVLRDIEKTTKTILRRIHQRRIRLLPQLNGV